MRYQSIKPVLDRRKVVIAGFFKEKWAISQLHYAAINPVISNSKKKKKSCLSRKNRVNLICIFSFSVFTCIYVMIF